MRNCLKKENYNFRQLKNKKSVETVTVKFTRTCFMSWVRTKVCNVFEEVLFEHIVDIYEIYTYAER